MGVSWAKSLAVVAMMVTVAVATAAVFVPGDQMPTAPSTAALNEIKPDEIEDLWAKLLVKDEAVGSRAMLEISSRSKADVVAFMAGKLKPLVLSEERAKKLLADLGDEKERVAKDAFEDLSAFDPRLVLQVGDILKDLPDGVHRQRVVALLMGVPIDSYARCSLEYQSSADATKNNPDLDVKIPGSIQIYEMPNKPAGVAKIQKGSFGVAETIAEMSEWQPPRTWGRVIRAVILLEHIGTPEALTLLKKVASGHQDASPTKEAKAALERMSKK